MAGQKNFLKDLSKEKPESFQEEEFVPARGKLSRIIIPITVILLIIAAAGLILKLAEISVPDMSGWQFADVQDWAVKYHDNTVLNGVYSKDFPQNKVISQSVKAGERISGSSILTITYSLGADPEEAVKVPDIKNLSVSEIEKWIDDNLLDGVSVKYETSDLIPKDKVINYEFVDGSQEEFLRKNRMVIYVSGGTEDMDQTIQMPDFNGKTRADVLQWAKDEQVEVNIQEEFDEYVDYGKVFDQSIKKDTKITRKDEVKVSISRGKSIMTPDFTGMSRDEASQLAVLYQINIFCKMEVSKEKADTVLSQDIPAGTEIDQKQVVTLIIARTDGKILVPDFTGLTQAEANSLAALYGIKVFFQNAQEAGESGIVASQSIASGRMIGEDKIITLKLKNNGKGILVPDFTGMTKNEAAVLAKNLGIDLVFNEEETKKTANQTITGQNVRAKEQIRAGQSILLTVAVNSGIRAKDLREMTLEEASGWAAQEGITLNVTEHYTGDYPAGEIYDQDCGAKDFIPSNKVLSVDYSLGLVLVDNFIGKTKSEIIAWAYEVNKKGAGITLSFKEDLNTVKSKGQITNQSILEEFSKPGDTITVWVSASDNGVLVKNFEGTELEDFKLWCDTNTVPYIVNDCYSDTVPEGKLFGQNYTDAYLPKGEHLRINHSLGKVFVKDFTGLTKSDVVEWQREVNKKMANIQVLFVTDYSSDAEKGRISGQSVKDAETGLDGTIIVFVSAGTMQQIN